MTRPRRSPVTASEASPSPTPAPADRHPAPGQGRAAAGRITRQVRFRATIPVKAAAIDIHGETGARLTLEIADVDMGDFLPVVTLRCKRLVVTVEEDQG
jgi:hypothetical protein